MFVPFPNLAQHRRVHCYIRLSLFLLSLTACLLVRTLHHILMYCAQVLKILERNVEANRHLFTAERSLTNADAVGATAHTGKIGDFATKAERPYDNNDNSHGGSGHCVAAVRELDWFTFSREAGPTDEAICDLPAGEGSQVRAHRRACEKTRPCYAASRELREFIIASQARLMCW